MDAAFVSMEPPSSLPQFVINGLLWAVTTLVGLVVVISGSVGGWLINRLMGKVDRLERDSADMPIDYIPRTELMDRLDAMSAERIRMHEDNREDAQNKHSENLQTLRQIKDEMSKAAKEEREALDGIHRRIDQIILK